MKKLFIFLMATAMHVSITAVAQYTETFESFNAGAINFTSNGKLFTITSIQPNTSAFKIGNFPGFGWSGTAADDKFIDNTGTGNINEGTGGEFTISSASAFTLKSMYLYLSRENLTFQNLSGSCTITGKLGGVTQFTASSSSGFNTNLGIQNGYTFINLANYGGSNNSNISIDAFTVKTTSNIGYIGLDAMTWASGSSLSTGITGSSFCSGATVPVSYTSSGYSFAAGNTFTAQLSNASGSFASPVNIGTLSSTAASGTIMAAIPISTSTGFSYRIRVVSSNPAVTGLDNGTNFNIIKTSAGTTSYLAPVNTNESVSVSGTAFNYISDGDCRAIAGITPNGAAPVSGNTSAKVWIEGTQPAAFVRRHYEITPTNNAASATGRITLYFTQADFDAFNAVNSVKLPANSGDVAGKASLLIEKRSGSGNANGDFTSYPGAATNIDPADADIVWNNDAVRWEVSFNTTGFSGFWVKTQATALPVAFGSISAIIKNGQLAIDWITESETNNDHFEILASQDGNSFYKIGSVLSKAKDGNSNNALPYSFSITENQARALAGLSFIGLLAIGCAGWGRRKKIISAVVLLLLSGVLFYSCAKSETDVDGSATGKLFVKIIQVDKDGTKNSSKTIQAVVQ